MAALTGLLAQPLDEGEWYNTENATQSAYDFADAMLEARKPKEP